MPERTNGRQRHFLFLQGPASTLFRKTGHHLAALGHHVTRINLSAGDWVFWHGGNTRNYRGSMAAWPSYLQRFCEGSAVTDIVLLGEERPHHKAAVAVAEMLGIDIFVIEMGYFRPDWITLERGGMSTNSHFPADPELIIRHGAGLPRPDFTPRHRQTFLAEAVSDLAFNLPNVFLGFLYPHYRWHALDHPLAEYGGWLRKFARASLRRRSMETATRALIGSSFFLYPLQLETDYQLRRHSPFASQFDAIDTVLKAFATSAPGSSRLALKIHPLDNDLRDWEGHVAGLARRLGLDDRVRFLHGGDLNALIAGCKGMVTVNSTVGLQALIDNKPVKVLGTAFFDVPGLTSQQSLSAFFEAPQPPNLALRDTFVALAAAAVHVRGNFYSRRGTDAGARAAALRLHEGSVNQPGAFVDPPPRRNR